MSTINPLLLTKLHTLSSIFFDQWRQVPLYRFPTFNQFQEPVLEKTSHNYNNSLQDLIKEDEDGTEDESGGGGTLKGLRVEKTHKVPK